MPAPIAKGIILLSSILIAAGIAAYENPEVKAWIDERRRKIALTINEIADEFDPGRSARRRRSSTTQDASTREDNSAEAAERRRRAREEIMERGLVLEQRRRAAQTRTRTSSSFDDMVDPGGRLKEKSDQAVVTSAEMVEPDQGLRNRSNQAHAVAIGSAFANPFDDELAGGVIDEKAAIESETQRERSTTLLDAAPLRIETTASQAATSQDQGNLTPTTSMAASTILSDSGMLTPTSTTHPLSDYHETRISQPAQPPAQSYQSIQEWASAASSDGPASFYSPPESERNYQILDTSMIHTPSHTSSTMASLIGTNDVASEGGDLGVDAISDAEVDTPSAWSEIGSQISED